MKHTNIIAAPTPPPSSNANIAGLDSGNYGRPIDEYGISSIETVVSRILAAMLPLAEIYFIPNHLKYSTLNDEPSNIQQTVFDIMRRINERAVRDDTLLTDEAGQGSFRSTLHRVSEVLSCTVARRRVHYVELGPEPVKTEILIRSLAQTNEVFYSGIDINKNSKPKMLEMLKKYLADDAIDYIVGDFYDPNTKVRHLDNEVRVITLLGFQEGNELPDKIGPVLERLGDTPTVILTEHQVFESNKFEKIRDFYFSQEMREFSSEILELCQCDSGGDYKVFLLPVALQDVVAAVCVTVARIGSEGGRDRYLITNVNLKPTTTQLKVFRERFSGYRELGQFPTGDGSVVFQLSTNQSWPS